MAIIQGNDNTTRLCNQLKRQAKQYPTLSKKEEQQMIEKYKNDRDKLNQLLYMHNIKLVFNIAKKYVSKTRDFDRLVQDGMYGLSEAVHRFDITKNIKFVTFAFWWIRKYILMNFDKKKNYIDRNSISLNAPAAFDDTSDSANGGAQTVENFIQKEFDPSLIAVKSIHSEISSDEQVEICKGLMKSLEEDNNLSSTDKAVFVDYFYNKEKVRDIAEKYGITKSEVSHIKNQILGKLKNVLSEDYHITSYDEVMS